MDTKKIAHFLRQLAESIREDVRDRKCLSGHLLEHYANELDPPAVVAALEETPPLSPADEESAKREEAPVVTKLRDAHAAKEAQHVGTHHARMR